LSQVPRFHTGRARNGKARCATPRAARGTWLTALSGDLGNGRFDGAYLVANFENMHPSNTYWQKLYHLYSQIDTEAPRFLGFENGGATRSCSTPEEMQWIADELFRRQ